jgi:hypothetical protein
MAALVEADRLEVERLAAEEGAYRCSRQGRSCALANVRRRERRSSGSAEQELVAVAARRQLVREQVASPVG